MALTNLQLIDLALAQAGLDSSFQATARLWLNHISRTMAERQDYPKFDKQATITFVPAQREYSLPSDFLRADTCYLYKVSTNERGTDILLVNSYMYDKYRISASGNPSFATIDEDNSQIIFNTLPADATQSARLRYFREPTAIALDTTDDAATPDFPDQDALLQELQKYALEYLDDPRQSRKGQEAKSTNRDFQKNMYNDDSYSQMPLENTHFRPTNRRGSRRRGF